MQRFHVLVLQGLSRTLVTGSVLTVLMVSVTAFWEWNGEVHSNLPSDELPELSRDRFYGSLAEAVVLVGKQLPSVLIVNILLAARMASVRVWSGVLVGAAVFLANTVLAYAQIYPHVAPALWYLMMPPIVATAPLLWVSRPVASMPLNPDQPSAPGELVRKKVEGDATGGLIPYKNVPALLSYYLGIFSLIPFIGFFLGIAALVLGLGGLKKSRASPEVKGGVHAGIGIGCGTISIVLWGGLTLVLIVTTSSGRPRVRSANIPARKINQQAGASPGAVRPAEASRSVEPTKVPQAVRNMADSNPDGPSIPTGFPPPSATSLPNRTPVWKGWPIDGPPPAISPFDAEQAARFQEAWARHLGVPVEYTNSIGMKFRLIPPGEFLMGTPEEELKPLFGTDPLADLQSESPRHQVALTAAIYLGIHEVTQSQYQTVMSINPSHFARTGKGQAVIDGADTGDFPVETVSWKDAIQFCATLSKREGLLPFDADQPESSTAAMPGYRLPTEAQWEFACRAGTETRYWTGDSDASVRRAGLFNSAKTQPVGQLAGNAFGLYDVHGNVWEWCLDGWDPAGYQRFPSGLAIDPFTPWNEEPKRLARGAHFYYGPIKGRSARRHAVPSSLRYLDYGFRAALSVDSVKAVLARPKQR